MLMPKLSTHALIWSTESKSYALFTDGHIHQRFVPGEEEPWFAWLVTQTSFSFQGRRGRMSVIKEARPRGEGYWYAYAYIGQRSRKRYLGRTAMLSLTRLEEAAQTLTNHNTPASSQRAHLPSPVLLTTKFHVPRIPKRLVHRPHLNQLLQRGLEQPLTLIAAPAGFGKTMAVCDWIRQQALPVAWVSFDEHDNEPVQFWTYVLTAVERLYPGSATTALAMLQTPHIPPISRVLHTFLNALSAGARDLVLVLDDYHLITEPALHETLALLLEHPPAQFHLYLLTRAEPSLPLSRLRAYGQVNELRTEDLRFHLDEVSTFLHQCMDLPLPAEDVAQLARRIDGWVAGLQLVSLSLRGHVDPSRFVATFGGSHRDVLAYLVREVLARQTEDVYTFLLQTSLLERMTGPLCDALTGQRNGQEMLEHLERANLFLVPLDDEGRWYRYHHLFADLLRHRLHQEASEQVPLLQRRAAHWFEREGWAVEAVQHWLAVSDEASAARVIEQSARTMMMRGEISMLRRLLEQLPEQVILQRPHLCLFRVQLHFTVGLYDAAERLLVRLEATLRQATPAESALAADEQVVTAEADNASESNALFGGIAAAKAQIATTHGDGTAALAYAQAALTRSPEEDSYNRCAVMLTLANAYYLLGKPQEADSAYAEASRLGFASGNLLMAMLATGVRSLSLFQRGRLRLAADLCRQSIHVAEARGSTARALAGQAYVQLGEILYAWYDLAEARLALEQAIALGKEWANAEDQISGHALLAQVHQAQGQIATAQGEIRQAEELLQTEQISPWLPAYVGWVKASLAYRQGRVASAEQWIQERGQADLGGSARLYHQELKHLTVAHVLMAQEKWQEAAALLEQLRHAIAEEQQGYAIDTLVLLALVQQAQGESPQALETLTQALSAALPEGYLRPFIEAGLPLRSLLVRLREQQAKGSDMRRALDGLLAAFEQRAGKPRWHVVDQPSLEPLSEREREVLQLLAQGHSNQAIARHLVISIGTVKTHLHHLYAKLPATDRHQAVKRASELGLLDQ